MEIKALGRDIDEETCAARIFEPVEVGIGFCFHEEDVLLDFLKSSRENAKTGKGKRVFEALLPGSTYSPDGVRFSIAIKQD